jgi:hypothetical protein
MIDSWPWWSFVIPVLLFGTGIAYGKWKVPVFPLGFIAGFIVWFGGNFYFNEGSAGLIIERLAHWAGLPVIFVFIAAGITGGLVAGLALYTGKVMLFYKDVAAHHPTRTPISK